MFYSQYILAKKGPLGTIWIAAHLERKLRKNQVTETDIPRSVDSIMFPEVPIALRLSSHLLLGVVRIYSRKVNYLFHDCNEALLKLKNAFTSSSAPVDLPAESTTVPFHSITLPETFEFDAIQPDEAFYATYSLDHHVTTRDQITLDEPVEEDVYPGSQFEQEERFGTPHVMDLDGNEDAQNYRNSDRSELQEDVLPPMDMDTGPLTNEAEVPDVEKLRSAGNINVDEDFLESSEKHDASPLELQPDPARLDGRAEGTGLAEDEQPSLSTPSLRPEASSPSHISSLQRSGGSPDGSPGLAVVETPVPPGGKPSRKRKQRFDTSLTLSESEMKGNLNDSSDLRRVRRKVANAQHEILFSVKERLGKRIFSKPSVPGLCSGLEELYDRVLNVKRLKPSGVSFAPENRPANDEIPVVPEEPQVPIAAGQYPASPTVVASQPEAPAVLRSPDRHAEPAVWETPVQPVSTPEHEGGRPEGLQTPSNIYFREMETDATPSANFATETDQTPSSELRSKANEERRSKAFEKTVSASIEDVKLSTTNGTAIDSSLLLTTNDVSLLSSQSEGWSERSRAIAQFLRATFEAAPNVKVSIDRLLKGKTRKEAARMFFETLVLRSNDYITVQQDSPYEDMNIYGQPKLMKAIL